MKINKYILLYFSFFIYSLSAVLSKFASGYDIFSIPYFLLLGSIFAILAIYAVLWQQVLRNFSLSVAFANKPITIVFGFLWAVTLFGETLSLNNIVGGAMIIAGIIGVMRNG